MLASLFAQGFESRRLVLCLEAAMAWGYKDVIQPLNVTRLALILGKNGKDRPAVLVPAGNWSFLHAIQDSRNHTTQGQE